MQEKISYLNTKCTLMRLSMDYRANAIVQKAMTDQSIDIVDSLTKFLKENSTNNPLGDKRKVSIRSLYFNDGLVFPRVGHFVKK